MAAKRWEEQIDVKVPADKVWPLVSEIPVHWIVLPATATEPVLAETQPAALVVVGAVQPAGTTMSTSPPKRPLEGAV